MIKIFASVRKALKSKFARSIMVPLISIFVVVLAAIIFIVFSSFSNEIRNDTLGKKLQQLCTTEQNISTRMDEINNISNYISNNSQFRFINSDNNSAYASYTLTNALKELLVGNDFVSYLSYYRISEKDMVNSSAGKMQFHTFWKGYVGFNDETEEEYLDRIRAINNRKVLPLQKSTKGRSYLTMVYPLPLYQKTPSAYVIAYINGSKIDTISNSLFADCQGEMIILDLNDNPIYHYISTKNKDITGEILKKIPLLSKDIKYRKIIINDEDYLLFQHISDYNGWKYISLIQRSDITSRLTDKQISFILLLLYIILGAIIAIIVCVLFNYRSINALAQTISKDLKIGDENEFNEQLLLSNTYAYLREKTQTITQNLFLSNLLEGQYDETTIDFALNECNLHFEYSSFIACVVYFHGTMDKKKSESIIEFIKEYFDVYDLQCYPLYQSNPNRILIVFNAEEDMLFWDVFEPILSTLYYDFGKEYSEIISIGVGNKYSTLLKVNDSAHEAISAMYLCILEGERFIKRYNDIDMEYITNMFSSITTRLISNVRQGDINGIHNVINELNSTFVDHSFSVQHQNFLAYNILTSITDYVNDPGISEEINMVLGRILKRSQLNNLVIFNEIERLCVTIANHRNESKSNNRNTDLINTIKKTISDNLCDSMMSLESISDACGISPSYLSRCFKAQMGCTPMHYVDTLRKNLVKEKLSKTDQSLKQILVETGFIDQSNFIRKFRKIEGVTPMTYRKLYRSSEQC